MLQKTKAAASLEDACRRLGLPLSTAAALLQFLSVKRTHDDFVDAPSKQLRMSPGAKLDTLWHCMLLNTAGTTASWCAALSTYSTTDAASGPIAKLIRLFVFC